MDATVAMRSHEIEMRLLLEAIYLRYQYDFRHYAAASLKRRLTLAMERTGCRSLSHLQDRVLHEPALFPVVLDYLTVQVSDLFRDPAYFRAVREHVVPVLRTYPSLKIWVAGCSSGEEVYSMAILLHEAGLLDRSLIYGTDINAHALERARAGVYDVERVHDFTQNHRLSGAPRSLSAYYTAAYGKISFDKIFRPHVVFADHSLATDNVFSEMQFVSCRNVLIYFKRALQDRAVGLFHESLCHRGFLGIGANESIRFSSHAAGFDEFVASQRLYRRRA